MPGYTKSGGGKKGSMVGSRKISSKPTVAMRMIAKGAYYVVPLARQTGQNWGLATTYSLATTSTFASDYLLQVVRWKLWMGSLTEALPITMAVIKCADGKVPADYDISDTDVLDGLRAEGRLFYFGTELLPLCDPDSWPQAVRNFKFEFKNVRLEAGEQLAIVFRTLNVVADGWTQLAYSYASTEL